jgi:Asp-tRNA(Asn)/Glu-tRNA(Gln) amidotransferase A subunit family amidase
MRDALGRAADLAANAGFDVGEIGEPEAMARAREVHAIIQNHEAGLSCGSDLARFRDRLSGILTSTIEDGQAITPSQYDDARRLAKRGRGATRGLFGEVDILLTPSAPGAAPRGLETTGDPRFNKLWTLMGSPTINIPGFRDQDGMPLGIQAVARFGQDKTLLCVAAMLEKAFRT